MKLITKAHYQRMLANGRKSAETEGAVDHWPVVKLFTPDAGCTWLLSELDPDEPDIAHGLCDLGMGCPELGTVRLSAIADLRGKLGLPVERDRHFKATKRLSAYAADAHERGCIRT